ncbi:hypothetical protein MTR67_010498 [Solanum verrucosum]|uniref:Peptidase S59 domain-containing protein n=1 Tax=Solanum verrucosum TaxID=315347 RepID=A0AAF0Q657_SOLVR|nr:hypothetical protein MTR67_010498 [Solanum verrucosum]
MSQFHQVSSKKRAKAQRVFKRSSNTHQTLFFGPLQPEMTPKVGATLPTTNASHSSTGMHDRDKVGDKPKLVPEEMHYDNCVDDYDVDGIMPNLQCADYYTVPPMEELLSKEKEEAGFCCHVKDLVFNHREVIIYMDESKKPPVGQGLNKPAEMTLLNVRCIYKSNGKEYKDGPMVNKYRDTLIKKTV